MSKKQFSFYSFAFLLCILAVFTQCVSTKVVPLKPSWIDKKPIDTEHYIGISSSPKGTKNADYQQLAKINALNDLASEISVQISNTSLLYTLSSNNILRETFDSKTLTSTNELLEGYEMVDSFEDETNYWVYYQLSKQKYREIKQTRINKAISIALSKYEKAKSLMDVQQYYGSLILLLKAVEDVKLYLTEPLIANYQQKEINFGTALLNDILFCSNEIKINSDPKPISVKRAKPINENSLSFLVTNHKGASLENIPIIADFSGGTLINDKSRTSMNGVATFSIPKVKSKNKIEYFTAKVDINSILQEATTDFRVRKIFRNLKTNSLTKQINIQNPTIFIQSNDDKINGSTTNLTFKNRCYGEFIKNNIDLTDEIKLADYKLEIISNVNLKNTTNNGYTVSVDAAIAVRTTDNIIVYQRNIMDLIATDLTLEQAKNAAFKRTNDYLAERIIPDIVEQLF